MTTTDTTTIDALIYEPPPAFAPEEGETLSEYRARALRYVLEHDSTWRLSDEALQAAAIGVHHAIVSLPGRLDGAGAIVLSRLIRVQERIRGALLDRERVSQQAAAIADGDAVPPADPVRGEFPTGGDQPGRPAPILPPAPPSAPPALAIALEPAPAVWDQRAPSVGSAAVDLAF